MTQDQLSRIFTPATTSLQPFMNCGRTCTIKEMLEKPHMRRCHIVAADKNHEAANWNYYTLFAIIDLARTEGKKPVVPGVDR